MQSKKSARYNRVLVVTELVVSGTQCTWKHNLVHETGFNFKHGHKSEHLRKRESAYTCTKREKEVKDMKTGCSRTQEDTIKSQKSFVCDTWHLWDLGSNLLCCKHFRFIITKGSISKSSIFFRYFSHSYSLLIVGPYPFNFIPINLITVDLQKGIGQRSNTYL